LKYARADVTFLAGEASGDLQAALVAGALRELRPALTISGIGGERLRAAGARVFYESPDLASIGPLAVLPRIPQLYLLLRGLEAALRRHPPGLLVPVDAGAFNLRLCTLLRRHDYRGPIVYYFPPGAWLDNAEQARRVASLSLPVTPFAHQRDFYERLGLRIAYFGHPLVSVIAPRPADAGLARPSIAVLPGSRAQEVALHVPVLARAAVQVASHGGVHFVAAAATPARERQILRLWERHGGPQPLQIVPGSARAALEDATLAWAASGTAVLEAALLGVPIVSFYRLTPAQYRFAQRWLPPHLLRTVALPNLVLGRQVIPELLQDDFQADAVVRESERLLSDEAARRAQREAFGELRAALGPPDALHRIAAFLAGQLEAQAA
jgi:lipid-A-disaccharide synthase